MCTEGKLVTLQKLLWVSDLFLGAQCNFSYKPALQNKAFYKQQRQKKLRDREGEGCIYSCGGNTSLGNTLGLGFAACSALSGQNECLFHLIPSIQACFLCKNACSYCDCFIVHVDCSGEKGDQLHSATGSVSIYLC